MEIGNQTDSYCSSLGRKRLETEFKEFLSINSDTSKLPQVKYTYFANTPKIFTSSESLLKSLDLENSMFLYELMFQTKFLKHLQSLDVCSKDSSIKIRIFYTFSRKRVSLSENGISYMQFPR